MTQAITTAEPKQAAPSPITLRAGGLMPDSMDGIWRLAQAASVAGVIPSAKSKEQAFILLAAGFEAGLGFTATCKNVMLVNNRPSLWGDAALALVVRSPMCKGVVEHVHSTVVDKTETLVSAVCTVTRDGWAQPVSRTFSVIDAKKAGLWGKPGPWTNYPQRMLQMRARAFALRDAFPDLLMGLGIVEESEDIPVSTTAATTTPSGEPERVALPDVPDEATAPLAGEDEAQRAKDADGASFLESLKEPPVGTVGHKK